MASARDRTHHSVAGRISPINLLTNYNTQTTDYQGKCDLPPLKGDPHDLKTVEDPTHKNSTNPPQNTAADCYTKDSHIATNSRA